jgi:hypothetical protein
VRIGHSIRRMEQRQFWNRRAARILKGLKGSHKKDLHWSSSRLSSRHRVFAVAFEFSRWTTT